MSSEPQVTSSKATQDSTERVLTRRQADLLPECLMPVIHPAATAVHQMHGTSFTSYASPAHGSKELCAWRTEIPGHTQGTPHHVSREEVLYILSGTIRATIGEQSEEAAAGDVILVPAGSRFGADNLTDEPAIAWVTTSAGFMGVMPDGSWITPPWTR